MVPRAGLVLLIGLSPLAAIVGRAQPPLREFALPTIEALGREIYLQDIASARGADILLAEGVDLAEHSVLGWITTQDEQGPLVTYVGLDDGEFVAVFDIRPEAAGDADFRQSRHRRLSEGELTRFVARMTAIRGFRDFCATRYNTVILEDPASDGWLVYLLAAVTERDLVPFGGHYRMSISADGTEIRQADRLFDECLSLSLMPDDPAQSPRIAELSVDRDFGAMPFETDVFLSLSFGVDLRIVTPAGVETWLLSRGSVRRLSQEPGLL